VTTPEPGEFAERWIAAWNARDIEAVLTDYSDDVVFTSPTAARFIPESGGTRRPGCRRPRGDCRPQLLSPVRRDWAAGAAQVVRVVDVPVVPAERHGRQRGAGRKAVRQAIR